MNTEKSMAVNGGGRLTSLLLGLLIVSGCQTVQVPLPDSLQDADVLAVDGLTGWRGGRDIHLGEQYRFERTYNSWTRQSTLRAGPYERSRSSKRFSYRFSDDDKAWWDVNCTSFGSSQGVTPVLSPPGSPTVPITLTVSLECGFEPLVEGAESMSLELEYRFLPTFSGLLSVGKDSYRIKAESRIQDANTQEIRHSPAANGYIVSDFESELAVVDMHALRIVLSPEMDPELRRRMAAAALTVMVGAENNAG